MAQQTRREFLAAASAATLAFASPLIAQTGKRRVFIASGGADGILACDWDPEHGELAPAGVAAQISTIDWLTFSPDRKVVIAAAEVETFNGKPTGEVASFRLEGGKLEPLSAVNSASKGTCHIAVDHSGRVLLAADYGGGCAASFRIGPSGQLSDVVWREHYTINGPKTERPEAAHAHFASFSPDNRFAYINDLGSNCVHIYKLDSATAMLTPAGTYVARAGAGPRTLHFHRNGHTAYSVNELDSTVDVLNWQKGDGSLTLVRRIELLPTGYNGPTRACDTVIAKDGRFVYFANRGGGEPVAAGSFDPNFIYGFRADAKNGALTPIGRTRSGGVTPRNFTLDPTERWMLVANQDSNLISVFARNPETGALANEGNSFAAKTPMCILFA